MEPQTISGMVVGDEAVGKSCLIACQQGKVFQTEHIPTEFFIKQRMESTIDGKAFSILLWDSPSQDDYYKGIPAYPRFDVLLICFAVDSPASYESARDKWYRQMRRLCPKAPLILIGTKLDLRSSGETAGRQITQLQGRELASKVNAVSYRECSSLNQQSVNEVFDEIVYTKIGLPSIRSGVSKPSMISFRKFRRKSLTKLRNSYRDSSLLEDVKERAGDRQSKRTKSCSSQVALVEKQDPNSTSSHDSDGYLMADFAQSAKPTNIYDEIQAGDSIEPDRKLATTENQGGSEIEAAIELAALAQRQLPKVPDKKDEPTTEAPPPVPNRRSKERQKIKTQTDVSGPAQPDFKLIAVGDDSVGKTCLLTAYAEGICPLEYVPTETDDCLTKEVQVNGDKIGIGLWDLSGSRDFDRMRPENYRQTDAILICFSVASPATFDSVGTRWKPEVDRFSPDTPIILVGTKADLRDDRAAMEKLRSRRLSPICSSRATEMAKEIGAELYVECSALTRQGLDAAFVSALRAAFDRRNLRVASGYNSYNCRMTGNTMPPETHSQPFQTAKRYPISRPRRSIVDEDCSDEHQAEDKRVELRKSPQQSLGSVEEDKHDVGRKSAHFIWRHRKSEPIWNQQGLNACAFNSILAKASIVSDRRHGDRMREVNPRSKPISSELNSQENAFKGGLEATIPSSDAFQPSEAQIRLPDRREFEQRYPVTLPQGFCLVINIANYKDEKRFKKRNGSEFDVKRVKDVFTKLNFIVKVHEDLTCNQIAELLSLTALSPELSDHGCFVCFIMAHGAQSSIFGIDGEALEIESIVDRFRGNQCHRLRHKPKLFFIQACRGAESSESFQSATVDQQSSDVYYCPKDLDFLLCFASPSGQVSLRHANGGSPFVQTLCSVIEEEHKSEHLVDMLTNANGRLKKSPVYREGNQAFVVSETVTRLSKKCFLDPDLAYKSGPFFV